MSRTVTADSISPSTASGETRAIVHNPPMTSSSPSPPRRIALVGAGRVARTAHLPALAGRADARLVAIVDPDTARARQAVADDPGIRILDSLDELDANAVDVVAIGAPAEVHRPLFETALGLGCHVLVEKPLALTLADATAMREALPSGRVAAVGHNMRCHRLVREARARLAAGAIGELLAIELLWCGSAARGEVPAWRASTARGGGVVHEVVVHQLDLVTFLSGSAPRSVAARGDAHHGTRAVALVGETGAGTPFSAAASDHTANRNGFVLVGSDGVIEVDLYRFDGLQVRGADVPGGDIGWRVRELRRTARALPGALRRLRSGGDMLDTYRGEWDRFLAAIDGHGDVACDLDAGRDAVAAMLAVGRALREGGTVEIERPIARPHTRLAAG